jgi:hypothetical protein
VVSLAEADYPIAPPSPEFPLEVAYAPATGSCPGAGL